MGHLCPHSARSGKELSFSFSISLSIYYCSRTEPILHGQEGKCTISKIRSKFHVKRNNMMCNFRNQRLFLPFPTSSVAYYSNAPHSRNIWETVWFWDSLNCWTTDIKISTDSDSILLIIKKVT